MNNKSYIVYKRDLIAITTISVVLLFCSIIAEIMYDLIVTLILDLAFIIFISFSGFLYNNYRKNVPKEIHLEDHELIIITRSGQKNIPFRLIKEYKKDDKKRFTITYLEEGKEVNYKMRSLDEDIQESIIKRIS